jgi:anti-sigma B factor antagonist
MFRMDLMKTGTIQLFGRFDASQVENARSVFDKITMSSIVDFKDLEYISSAGLGVLLMTQKRLRESGNGLKLINLNKHIRDVFYYAAFDTIFEIE